MKEIFNSKHILMIISGDKKEKAFKDFKSGRIDTKVPSSLLWLHPNVTVVYDKEKFTL